jgi:hypothetical protein
MLLTLVLVAAFVALAAFVAARSLRREIEQTRAEVKASRVVTIVGFFAPAIVSARTDPSALLTWQPLARLVRQVCPDDFAFLDRAAGSAFPFSNETLQAAHAQWTADWLAWELAHDAEYKLKAAEVEHELAASGGAPFVRAKLDAVEREKLDRYQRRYQEYVQVAKALQALISP